MVFLSIGMISFAFAQIALRVIKANSKNAKIIDGKNVKDNFWVIFPETKPDIYYIDLPRKNQTVKFITDIDSISFELKFGEIKDFIVLLNGKDSCYTRVSATYKNLKTPTKSRPGNDTIPFSLRGDRIYFKGKINGSNLLNIQFDLGAEAMNLNKNSIEKLKIDFNKKGWLSNSDGQNETRVSTSNEIEIAGLKWSGIEIYETSNMDNDEDAIVGNSFFLDRSYKIDYEKSYIIVFQDSAVVDAGFLKQDIILDNGIRPFFEATFTLDGKSYTDWFLFDTGNSSNGILSSTFLERHHLYASFSTVMPLGRNKIAFMPELNVGGTTVAADGAIALEKLRENGSNLKLGGLIGNQLLKRFDVVIDNRNGLMYLKPNANFEIKSMRLFKIVGSLIVLLFITIIILFKLKRKNEK